MNGVDLLAELHAALVAYDSKQWGIFGYNLGGALRKIIIGGAPASAKGLTAHTPSGP